MQPRVSGPKEGAIVLAIIMASTSWGCVQPPREGPGEEGTGKISASLTGDLATEVTSVRVDVSLNGAVVDSRTVKVSAARGSGGPDGGPLADAFFVERPGLYGVAVVPLAANGPSQLCTGGSTTVQVAASMTTETSLAILCAGAGSGGLDVSVTASVAPSITGLAFDPGKCAPACVPVSIAVTAADPQKSPLTFGWKVVSKPEGKGAVVLAPEGNGAATFYSEIAGDFTLEVAVTNPEGQTAVLDFPVHELAGDPLTCAPAFTRLNPFTPAGDPIPGLEYGAFAHLDPLPPPGIPQPGSPVCLLTYQGGRTLSGPVIHLVQWGSSPNLPTVAAVTDLFDALFNEAGYRNYLSILAQYLGGAAPSGTVLPAVTITPSTQPATLSSAAIVRALAVNFRRGSDPTGPLPAPSADGNDVYVVILPPGVVAFLDGIGTSCSDFGGYHEAFVFQGAPAEYIVLPNCGPPPVTQAVASHELIETITDPDVLSVQPHDVGWYDYVCHGEIADLCEHIPSHQLGAVSVVSVWSNSLGACVDEDHETELYQTFGGTNVPGSCMSPVDMTTTVGGHCPAGTRRVSLHTTVNDMSPDTSCSAKWLSQDTHDCSFTLSYKVPQDCNKAINCTQETFVTVGDLPPSRERAVLVKTDGKNLAGVNNTYTFGGRCDDGYVRPGLAPIPTVTNNNAEGATCTAAWALPDDERDCTVTVRYITRGHDLGESITCETRIIELRSP
jgi:hypothetical protein